MGAEERFGSSKSKIIGLLICYLYLSFSFRTKTVLSSQIAM